MRVCNVSPQINELGERLHRRSVRYHATQNCWEMLRRNPFSGPGNLASPFNFTVTGSLSHVCNGRSSVLVCREACAGKQGGGRGWLHGIGPSGICWHFLLFALLPFWHQSHLSCSLRRTSLNSAPLASRNEREIPNLNGRSFSLSLGSAIQLAG